MTPTSVRLHALMTPPLRRSIAAAHWIVYAPLALGVFLAPLTLALTVAGGLVAGFIFVARGGNGSPLLAELVFWCLSFPAMMRKSKVRPSGAIRARDPKLVASFEGLTGTLPNVSTTRVWLTASTDLSVFAEQRIWRRGIQLNWVIGSAAIENLAPEEIRSLARHELALRFGVTAACQSLDLQAWRVYRVRAFWSEIRSRYDTGSARPPVINRWLLHQAHRFDQRSRDFSAAIDECWQRWLADTDKVDFAANARLRHRRLVENFAWAVELAKREATTDRGEIAAREFHGLVRKQCRQLLLASRPDEDGQPPLMSTTIVPVDDKTYWRWWREDISSIQDAARELAQLKANLAWIDQHFSGAESPVRIARRHLMRSEIFYALNEPAHADAELRCSLIRNPDDLLGAESILAQFSARALAARSVEHPMRCESASEPCQANLNQTEIVHIVRQAAALLANSASLQAGQAQHLAWLLDHGHGPPAELISEFEQQKALQLQEREEADPQRPFIAHALPDCELERCVELLACSGVASRAWLAQREFSVQQPPLHLLFVKLTPPDHGKEEHVEERVRHLFYHLRAGVCWPYELQIQGQYGLSTELPGRIRKVEHSQIL